MTGTDDNKKEKIRKLLKKLRNQEYYEKRKTEKVYCETCFCSVDKYQYKIHVESRKHANMLRIVDCMSE